MTIRYNPVDISGGWQNLSQAIGQAMRPSTAIAPQQQTSTQPFGLDNWVKQPQPTAQEQAPVVAQNTIMPSMQNTPAPVQQEPAPVVQPPMAMPYNEAVPTAGEYNMNRLMDTVKGFEGFSPTVHADYGNNSIGYGINVDSIKDWEGIAPDAPKVVTPEQASKHLEQRLIADRQAVADYAKKHGYNWGNNQIDSLTSFIFNLGKGSLDQVTKQGRRTNQEILEAIPLYNKAGGKTLDGLVKRRNSERDWFSEGLI